MAPVYNVTQLLAEMDNLICRFAEAQDFAPTRRGRLLVAMLLLANVAMLLREDNPSPELRRKLTSFLNSCMTRGDAKMENFFHDLLGIKFNENAEFTVQLDTMVH